MAGLGRGLGLDPQVASVVRFARTASDVGWDEAFSQPGRPLALLSEAVHASPNARLSEASWVALTDLLSAGGELGMRSCHALHMLLSSSPARRARAAARGDLLRGLAALMRAASDARAPALAAAYALMVILEPGAARTDPAHTTVDAAPELLPAVLSLLPALAEPALGCCGASGLPLTILKSLLGAGPATVERTAEAALALPGLADGLRRLTDSAMEDPSAHMAARYEALRCVVGMFTAILHAAPRRAAPPAAEARARLERVVSDTAERLRGVMPAGILFGISPGVDSRDTLDMLVLRTAVAVHDLPEPFFNTAVQGTAGALEAAPAARLPPRAWEELEAALAPSRAGRRACMVLLAMVASSGARAAQAAARRPLLRGLADIVLAGGSVGWLAAQVLNLTYTLVGIPVGAPLPLLEACRAPVLVPGLCRLLAESARAAAAGDAHAPVGELHTASLLLRLAESADGDAVGAEALRCEALAEALALLPGFPPAPPAGSGPNSARVYQIPDSYIPAASHR